MTITKPENTIKTAKRPCPSGCSDDITEQYKTVTFGREVTWTCGQCGHSYKTSAGDTAPTENIKTVEEKKPGIFSRLRGRK